jgi:hypothetical protein
MLVMVVLYVTEIVEVFAAQNWKFCDETKFHVLHTLVPQSCATSDPCPLVYSVFCVPCHTGLLPASAP